MTRTISFFVMITLPTARKVALHHNGLVRASLEAAMGNVKDGRRVHENMGGWNRLRSGWKPEILSPGQVASVVRATKNFHSLAEVTGRAHVIGD